ncbi:ECF transporter S component [Intestinimonas sp.]|uniref:ECF transporter S component n=1 Tax=Intestinimonas sp. TaxID=1965293 RepID=UPI0026383178|nr:ECF transporter S component [Intestinimonas sp.]
MKQSKLSPQKLAVLGMMTALVFASNYARIIMPIAIGGRTSFTLANIVCCLSGLLLGPVGGVASGLGSAIYDLTNPLYAAECWITFLTKGVMGLVAGLAVRRALERDKLSYLNGLFGAILGCAAYYVLYFAKSYFYDGLLIEGLQPMVALAALPLKLPASIFNAAVAIIAAPPLALAIRAALKRSGLRLKTA